MTTATSGPGAVPTKRFKSPYYYTLSQKGIQYLAAAGLDVSDAFRASKEVDKSWLFLEHTLELNDVLISAALLYQHIAGNNDHDGITLTTVVHERTLKAQAIQNCLARAAFGAHS